MNTEKYYEIKLKRAKSEALRRIIGLVTALLVCEALVFSVFRHVLNEKTYKTFTYDIRNVMSELDEGLQTTNTSKAAELEIITDVIKNDKSDITCFAVFEYDNEIVRTPENNDNKEIYEHLNNTVRRWGQAGIGRISESYYGLLRGNSFAKGEFYRTKNGNYYIISAGYINIYKIQADSKFAYITRSMYIFMGLILVAFIIAFCINASGYRRRRKSIEDDGYRNALFTAIAHDLKSPLTAISGYAENLMQLSEDVEARHYISSIVNNAEYMNEMLNQLTTYTKIDGNNRTKDEINVKDELKRIIDLYEKQLDDKSLRVDIKGNINLQADKTDVVHLLDNILTNAVKYSDEASDIVFAMNDSELRCTNSMKEEVQIDKQDIWKPLHKTDKMRSGRSGSGLGLSIIKKILDIYGWKGNINTKGNMFEIVIQF